MERSRDPRAEEDVGRHPNGRDRDEAGHSRWSDRADEPHDGLSGRRFVERFGGHDERGRFNEELDRDPYRERQSRIWHHAERGHAEQRDRRNDPSPEPYGGTSRGRRAFPPDRGQEAYERGQPGMAPQGRFAGHGPKDYRRSDERVREDVCDRLTADPHVDASDVAVTVTNGDVTLEGTVADRRMKRRAEECADEAAGAQQVHNRLIVQPPHRSALEDHGGERGWRGWDPDGAPERGRFANRGPRLYQRSDDRIREDVCDQLTDDDVVDATGLTVTVQDGEVTLSGTVHDRTMKRRAEDCVDEVPGVRQVHNRITLRPQTEPRPAPDEPGR